MIQIQSSCQSKAHVNDASQHSPSHLVSLADAAAAKTEAALHSKCVCANSHPLMACALNCAHLTTLPLFHSDVFSHFTSMFICLMVWVTVLIQIQSRPPTPLVSVPPIPLLPSHAHLLDGLGHCAHSIRSS